MKTRNRKNVSAEGEQGDCYQWKEERQGTKGHACSFRHDVSTRGKVTQSSSPAPRPQTQKRGEKFFEREISQRP